MNGSEGAGELADNGMGEVAVYVGESRKGFLGDAAAAVGDRVERSPADNGANRREENIDRRFGESEEKRAGDGAGERAGDKVGDRVEDIDENPCAASTSEN